MARTINTTNTVLNNAIWTVLTTQFKKEAPKAFEMVKAAGYEYSKNNGSFEVYNPRTKRRVHLYDRGYGRYAATYVSHGYYECQQSKITNWNNCRFDFVGCLEKPLNDEWHRFESQASRSVSKSRSQYERLSMKKSMVRSYEKDIDRIKEKMAELQEQLIKATERKVSYEREVVECKKELGLA